MSFSKHRRSNWYIYIITFIITFVLLGFVVYQLRYYLFVKRDEIEAIKNQSDFRPEASQNMTVLFMLSEMKGGIPQEYMIVNYRPRDGVVMCIPVTAKLTETVGEHSGTLTELYETGGAKSIVLAIKNAMDVTCEYYVKFDKDSFAEFVSIMGNATVSVPYDLNDDDKNTVFAAGTHDLAGDDLFKYLTFPNLSDDEEYKGVMQASAVRSLINQNINSLTTGDVSSLYRKILTSTDTDMTEAVFSDHLHSFYFTIANTYDPALFYVPYGEYDDSGAFTVSEECKEKIKVCLCVVE